MEDKNIQFVREVEKYPELYNYTKPGYSRRNIVEKAWAEVGRKFNLTGFESKEKWRNLRNSFVKNLKPPASGASGKKKKTYYLSEAMLFALPFVKVAGTASGSLPEVPINIIPESELLEDSFLEEEALEQSEMYLNQPLHISPLPPPNQSLPISPLPTPPCPSTSSSSSPALLNETNQEPSFSGKRKRATSATEADKNIADYFLAKKKYVESKQRGSNQTEAMKMFLLSLIPDLEALTQTQIRAFKRKTLSLIEELSDEGTRSTSEVVVDFQIGEDSENEDHTYFYKN